MLASHGSSAPSSTVGLAPDAARAPAHPWEKQGQPPHNGPPSAPPVEVYSASPELTVHQYASLCAELSRTHDPSSVLQRHHLTLTWWQDQNRAWEDRLKRNPELLARYQEVRRALQHRR
jgi:GrpB-like predicted nucleotidyltransferase (UPF0157 family)